jgi:hypothetical protein
MNSSHSIKDSIYHDRDIHQFPFHFSLNLFHTNNMANFCIESRLQHAQDPFSLSSWTRLGEITYDSTYPLPNDKDQQETIQSQFHDRYAFVKKILLSVTPTSTYAKIYHIKSRNVKETALPLLMKVVPLKRALTEQIHKEDVVTADILAEIYNEIVIGYFLNKLAYGFSSIYTMHFMIVFDWFTCRGTTLFRNYPNDYDKSLNQVTIVEKSDILLCDFIQKYPYISVLKALLFQLFYSLEIAWYMFEFIHHDLHMANIMLTEIKDDDGGGGDEESSRLFNKNFVYKRLYRKKKNESNTTQVQWYNIKKHHLMNHFVKIIDFGRSRMKIPSNKDNANRHYNNLTVQIEGNDYYGYSCKRTGVNRQIDVYMPLLSILSNDTDLWERFEVNNTKKEMASFFQFCDAIIPFKEINDTIIDKNPKWVNEREFALRKVGNIGCMMGSQAYIHCPGIKSNLTQFGVFITKFHKNHTTTVTEALNHHFFDEYVEDEDMPSSSLAPLYQHLNENVLVANPSLFEFDHVLKNHSIEGKKDTKKSFKGTNVLNCMICGKETIFIHCLCSNQCFYEKYGSSFVLGQ